MAIQINTNVMLAFVIGLIFSFIGLAYCSIWLVNRISILKEKLLKPTIPIVVNEKKILKLHDKINKLDMPERLALLRTLFGSSYKVLLEVSSTGITIKGIGTYATEDDESREDITG